MAKVFFSYSHDDEEYRNQLAKHLAALKHEGLIEVWHDRQIIAGAIFGPEIERNLEESDVILLLVSSSFVDSGYCYGIEMARALELHAEGKAHVIPVIVRPCDWTSTPIGRLLAVPHDGKPITSWPNRDEAYLDAARAIRRVVASKLQESPTRVPRRERPPAPQVTQGSRPRSNNVRLRAQFTDADQDQFLHEGFAHIAEFFKESLQELQQHNRGLEVRFRMIDANSFTAIVFRNGKRETECLVRLGGGLGDNGIAFSHSTSANPGSFNELLSVHHDEQKLYFSPLGLSFGHSAKGDQLSADEAAEFLWSLLIERLR